MHKRALLLALVTGVFGTAHADTTVTATLHFEHMLPFTGIVYAPDPADIYVQRALLDQHNKQFSAPIVVVSPNGDIKVTNSDDFEHNVYVDDRAHSGVAFDVGRIEAHEEFRVPVIWQPDTLLRLGCKIHPRMRSYIANIRSHHFGVIDFMPGKFDYQLTLEHIPERLDQINILLPDLPLLSTKIKPGQNRNLTIIVDGKKVGTIQINRVEI